MTDIRAHYASGDPLTKLTQALDRLAPGGRRISLEELGGFDDFHTAGRFATVRLADLLAPGAGETVLDAGSGLGGPARYLAARAGCHVIGVDLTPQFVEAGRLLNERTGMNERVTLRVGDISALDLATASVDHIWTQHVAMNIADRPRLYAELRRVLRPGGRFALFDVVDGGGGDLLLPVPWATRPEHSHLVSRERLRDLVEAAGFRTDHWEDPTIEMVEQLRRLLEPPPPGATPPQLSARIFIDDLETKAVAYFRNMAEGRTALALGLFTAM